MRFDYIDIVRGLIDTVEREEAGNMERCVELLAECVRGKHSIYTFGASHAGILSEELYYRAGGLMLMNPIFGREIMLDTAPITHTSHMERLVGYGTQLARDQADFRPGDVLIAHSVSGRNPVTVEVAMAARDAGASVIALTNLAYSRSVASRHPSGLRLFELADVVLDNHGEVGDAAVAIDGLDQRVSPTSTVVGAVMLNSIVAALVQRLVDEGMERPPVFYSANLDGGDELNQRLVDEYRDCIHYRF
ncbi:SIS domain-containing protein [Thermophilibacter sp.]